MEATIASLIVLLALIVGFLIGCMAHMLFFEDYSLTRKKILLDRAGEEAYAKLYKLLYLTEAHTSKCYVWYGPSIEPTWATIVPVCRAIVKARKAGVTVKDIAVVRVLGKPAAVEFTLPDVVLKDSDEKSSATGTEPQRI